MDDEIYSFRIGAYSPETIPMARLAEYMQQVALIYGETGSVHFKGLRKGSTVMVASVEREAAPKVSENVNAAQWPEAKGDRSVAYKRINTMLREDNAVGEIRRGKSRVLAFPGREIPKPVKLGPFTQLVSKDGELVRIGGRDSSSHASIQSADGEVWSFEVSRDLARQLAHHLFGEPLRLIGEGRAVRNEEGVWEFTTLRASRFEVLSNESLVEAVGRLRSLHSNQPPPDAERLRRMRDDEGGLH